jgi:tRNA(Glu) U13 pseudouridine synthase TruD
MGKRAHPCSVSDDSFLFLRFKQNQKKHGNLDLPIAKERVGMTTESNPNVGLKHFSNDPEDFIPRSVNEFYLLRLATMPGVPPDLKVNVPGKLKSQPEDFIVVEPVLTDYPGYNHNAHRNRILTVGDDSDLPGLYINPNQKSVRGVRCTLVKRCWQFFAARDELARMLSRMLRRDVRPEDITACGIKDRWAVTAQQIHIATVSYNELCRLQFPVREPGRAWFFIKDAYPMPQGRLHDGQHGKNHFDIQVRMPGWSKSKIGAYMDPRIELLQRNQWLMPNFYGRQRIGIRQNTHKIGRTLVTFDHQAPEGVDPFMSSAEAAVFFFLHELTGREHPMAEETRRKIKKYWLYNFDAMVDELKRVYKQASLGFEYKLALRLADTSRFQGDCQKVLASIFKDSSLLVGAWQSYWWNQALAVMLYHLEQMPLHERKTFFSGQLNTGYTPHSLKIPLLMDTDASRNYYGLLGFDQALDDLSHADDWVRATYLTPRPDRRTGEPGVGPWRRAFIGIEDCQFNIDDEVCHCSFALFRGGYATSFLGTLFDISNDKSSSSEPEEEVEAA